MAAITVRLLGGAKKALGAGTVEIDADNATVGDILDMIEARTSGALAASNVLVAVNGADSSAAGGRAARIRAGDDVAVIPVVHGGGGTTAEGKVDAEAGRRGRRQREIRPVVSVAVPPPSARGRAKGGGKSGPENPRTVEAYAVESGRRGGGGGVLPALDDLRAEFPSVAIQAVSARFVLSASHLRRVVAVSAEAERRRIMVARRLETDMLARLAGTSQISEAIKAAGRKGAAAGSYIVVAVAPAGRLRPLRARLAPLASASPPPAKAATVRPGPNTRFLARRFGIAARGRAAVVGASGGGRSGRVGGDPLEDLLVERAAVVGV